MVAHCFTVRTYIRTHTHDVPHTSVRLMYHSNAKTKLKLGVALSVAINNIIIDLLIEFNWQLHTCLLWVCIDLRMYMTIFSY